MADKIFKREGLQITHYVCGCLDQGHNLNINIEHKKDGSVIHCEFCLYLAGKAPLRYRIKEAWKCLKGKDGALGQFILRPEDYPEIVGFLSQLVTSPNTAGTFHRSLNEK